MTSLKKKIGFIILIFLTSSSIISPAYINGSNKSLSSKNLKNLKMSYNNTKELFSAASDSEKYNEAYIDVYMESVFDALLTDDLSDNYYNSEIRIIILFKENISKSYRKEILDSIFQNFEIIHNYDIIPGVDLKCNIEELKQQREIIEQLGYIQKVLKSKTYTLPYIDEDLPSSSVLRKDSFPNWWVSAIGADDLIYNGTGIKVAVIDTGIYDHPDLNIGANKNFVTNESSSKYEDDVGHGTHCAGIIGSDGGGSNGLYRGIAPGVTLINARAGDISGLDDGDIIAAIEWCVNTEMVDIISMSFGDISPVVGDPLGLALSEATENGIICVSSAGNSGSGYISGGSPASAIDVIAVGASDINNNLAYFSSWGPSYTYLNYPDLVAPGVNIISTESAGSLISDENRLVGDYFDFAADADYIPLSGTSMSCPMVAGALAILKQAYPSITPESARIALLEGATKLLNERDAPALRSGFGLINVSRSLEFLNEIYTNKTNINNIALIAPNELPVAPFDLLNFPGDSQLFNLTIISGNNNSFDINIPPEVGGLRIISDKSQLTFNESGIEFIGLYISINLDAQPGPRYFSLNITSGIELYDEIIISINVKYPENRILLDSFHGLNDWNPLTSVYQMNFYEWMKDITELDIEIDYLAEYWTPNYDKLQNNSILTEERLAQYDLIVLQNPIIPYTPNEIDNLNSYFMNGGNILFLGTRYQDMCLENINSLFTTLDVDIQIASENLLDESWLGIDASVNPQTITEFNNSLIFDGVTNFLWNYGSKLLITGEAKPLASKNGDILVANCEVNTSNKGKFVIFGDLHWTSLFYDTFGYSQNHKLLTQNLMDYFFGSEEISLSISLNSPSSSNSNLNISIYAKNKNSGLLIDSAVLNTFLNVSIKTIGFYDEILTNSLTNGLSYNYSYILPFTTSPNPYEINVNLSIDSQIFNETSKYLYYDDDEIPKIAKIIYSNDIERNGIDTLDIDAFLDNTTYNSTAYLSIYPYSYYSKTKTIIKTFNLTNSPSQPLNYSISYTPINTDPAGLVIFFVLPENVITNYTNPYVPRLITRFTNNPPKFNEESSTIIIDNNEILTLSETYDEDGLNPYEASQGSFLNFVINVSDSVSYEDQDGSQMIISVNFLLAAITQDNTLVPLAPSTYIHSRLSYDNLSNTQKGSFTIPFQMEFSSITGTKTISTASTYSNLRQDGYIGLILISVVDSEGEREEFIIVFLIQQSFIFDIFIIIIIIGVIVILGIGFIIISHIRRKRRSQTPPATAYYLREESDDNNSDTIVSHVYYCPFCGERLTGLRNFCPSCGKSLRFED